MNIQQIMKQAQSLQKKMGDLQNSLADVQIKGVSGNGMVEVITDGKGDIKNIKIDPKLVDPSDVEMLEDLIVAAFKNAKQNADQYTESQMSKMGISPEMMKFGA